MADKRFFAQTKRGAIFLNCARGAVMRTDDLLSARASGSVAHAVIDTWEGEPAYRADLLERVDLGTPHIAGYSYEGKVMGTVMVYREACRFLGVEPTWSPDNLWPAPVVPEIDSDARGRRAAEVLREIVRRVYDIEADDRRLREGCVPDGRARGAHFDRLRRDYPIRREFRFTRVRLAGAAPDLAATVAALGFAAGDPGNGG
jgi:erythronate-4-phosphate dehydrogenase